METKNSDMPQMQRRVNRKQPLAPIPDQWSDWDWDPNQNAYSIYVHCVWYLIFHEKGGWAVHSFNSSNGGEDATGFSSHQAAIRWLVTRDEEGGLRKDCDYDRMLIQKKIARLDEDQLNAVSHVLYLLEER